MRRSGARCAAAARLHHIMTRLMLIMLFDVTETIKAKAVKMLTDESQIEMKNALLAMFDHFRGRLDETVHGWQSTSLWSCSCH
jgi:hypothetical protein